MNTKTSTMQSSEATGKDSKAKGAGRVFIAGASGIIGRRLCTLLLEEGYTVIGTTRESKKAAALEAMGVIPVLVDVYDAEKLRDLLVSAEADIVIHQLTDLPAGLDRSKMARARVRNARLRKEGTRNLVAAAIAANVRRVIAQSIAFAYAPGLPPFDETAPLNVNAEEPGAAISARAAESLERQVLSGPFEGIILRYGKLYGPGTGFETPLSAGPVHVDAAAEAARRAMTLGEPGIYNIAENDGTVSVEKARSLLQWRSDFRFSRNRNDIFRNQERQQQWQKVN